jgi:hypothetical protein
LTISAAIAPPAPGRVLDDEILAESVAQALRGHPRDAVGIAAGSEGYDHRDRFLRPGLCPRPGTKAGGGAGREAEDGTSRMHGIPSI